MTNINQKVRLEQLKRITAETALWSSKDLEDSLAQPAAVEAAKAREAKGLHKVAIQCCVIHTGSYSPHPSFIVSNMYYLTIREINILEMALVKFNRIEIDKTLIYSVIYYEEDFKIDLPLVLYEAMNED